MKRFLEKGLKKRFFKKGLKKNGVGNLRKKKVDFQIDFQEECDFLNIDFLRRLNKKQKIKAPQPDSIDQIKRLS